MRILAIIVMMAMCAVTQMNAAPWGPVWSGPRPVVEWQGLTVTAAKMDAAVKNTTVQDSTPRWVGYVKRSRDEWWFRLVLADGKSEMVKRGGSTTDGWRIENYTAQANKPTSITLIKDGIEKILELTVEE